MGKGCDLWRSCLVGVDYKFTVSFDIRGVVDDADVGVVFI